MSRELVVWPSYIDAEKTRRMGRRIAKKKAVSSPKLREVFDAARALGLDPVLEEDKAYPREWWQAKGRVMVSKGEFKTKSKLLEAIAETILKKRSNQGA